MTTYCMPYLEVLFWKLEILQWGIQVPKSSTKPSRISVSMSTRLVWPWVRKKTPESLCRRQRMEIRGQHLRTLGLQQQQPLSLLILALLRGLEKKSSFTKSYLEQHMRCFLRRETAGWVCFHCVQRGRTSGASFESKEDNTKKTKYVNFVMILSSLFLLLAGKGGESFSFLRKPTLEKDKVWTGCYGAEQCQLFWHAQDPVSPYAHSMSLCFQKTRAKVCLAHPSKAQNYSSQ